MDNSNKLKYTVQLNIFKIKIQIGKLSGANEL